MLMYHDQLKNYRCRTHLHRSRRVPLES